MAGKNRKGRRELGVPQEGWDDREALLEGRAGLGGPPKGPGEIWMPFQRVRIGREDREW